MQDFKYLNVSYAGTGVADVMLARAPANAINDAMYREIEALFRGGPAFLRRQRPG
jgi:enoyl-CoA hydratase/carnithine racemase